MAANPQVVFETSWKKRTQVINLRVTNGSQIISSVEHEYKKRDKPISSHL